MLCRLHRETPELHKTATASLTSNGIGDDSKLNSSYQYQFHREDICALARKDVVQI